MKHLKLALLISAATLFAIACAGINTTIQPGNANNTDLASTPIAAAPAAPPDEFAAARATYQATCVRCHKETGEGGAVTLDEGDTLKVPSFKSDHSRKDSDEEHAEQITKGGDGMPAFGKRLSPAQINNLVRFIRHEFQSGAPTGGAASPAR